MLEALIFFSCASFILFLFPIPGRRWLAAAGWILIVAALYAEIPYFLSLNNFMYPIFAVLSVPFLYVTLKRLHGGDPAVMRLSKAAAVAFLIYAPFNYIPPLGQWLIEQVVNQTSLLLSLLNYSAKLEEWNIFIRNNFRVEIILACTGIQSIAIMLGVISGVTTGLHQKIEAFLLAGPVIYILNIIRNTFVIIAYTEQWFPFLPEIASNGEYGYESFFWAHNVISEILALVVLVAIAYRLFVIIPELGDWAGDLYSIYEEDLRGLLKDRGANSV
ncbi:MAG: archaeosortase A [Methanomicrobiales archaeon]|nr:archaeosortase A [Methanomicrobiales archaeon]